MATTDSKTVILNKLDIRRKLERMAYEIMENNDGESELYLIGIRKRGTQVARKLANLIGKISDVEVDVIRVELNKADPSEGDIELIRNTERYDGKVVILVDDVANTGRTLSYAIKPLLDHLPKKVQVAVLINREHKTFPISPDYTGLSLSTSLQEHIEVNLDSGKETVYLK